MLHFRTWGETRMRQPTAEYCKACRVQSGFYLQVPEYLFHLTKWGIKNRDRASGLQLGSSTLMGPGLYFLHTKEILDSQPCRLDAG